MNEYWTCSEGSWADTYCTCAEDLDFPVQSIFDFSGPSELLDDDTVYLDDLLQKSTIRSKVRSRSLPPAGPAKRGRVRSPEGRGIPRRRYDHHSSSKSSIKLIISMMLYQWGDEGRDLILGKLISI